MKVACMIDRPELCARCEERLREEAFRAWRKRSGEAAPETRNARQVAVEKTPALPAARPLWRHVPLCVLTRRHG